MLLTLGYHGCDLATAQQVLGGLDFVDSEKDYDWLGTGVYFWENDPVRALDWATQRKKTPPCVVGAVIALGICLDLTNQSGLRAVRLAFDRFKELQERAAAELPKNEDPEGLKNGDNVLRRLDRAVIEHLYSMQHEAIQRGVLTQTFETVRALFPEGKPLYDNAGFRKETHVQLCVRDHKQILGVFRLPDLQMKAHGFPDIYTAPSAVGSL